MFHSREWDRVDATLNRINQVIELNFDVKKILRHKGI